MMKKLNLGFESLQLMNSGANQTAAAINIKQNAADSCVYCGEDHTFEFCPGNPASVCYVGTKMPLGITLTPIPTIPVGGIIQILLGEVKGVIPTTNKLNKRCPLDLDIRISKTNSKMLI